MVPARIVVEQRQHRRAQLHQSVRLRWLGPLGSRLEICQTLDISRGGMLVYRTEDSRVGARVWVTFPFTRGAQEPQPETAARIVRVCRTPSGGFQLSLALESTGVRPQRLIHVERRASPRTPISIPFFIRTAGAPWAEEAMTLDVSEGGVWFETSLLYEVGDRVWARVDFGVQQSRAEAPARVVRIERLPGAVEQRVAIAWERAART